MLTEKTTIRISIEDISAWPIKQQLMFVFDLLCQSHDLTYMPTYVEL